MEYVIGWIIVRPDQREAFLVASRSFIEATRSEPGVLFFELSPSLDDKDLVLAVEGYASASDHEAHVRSAHFAAFWQVFQTHAMSGRFENIFASEIRTDEVRTS